MVGNLLPDFTKTLQHPDYTPDVLEGIALHRFIDAFTENHPVVKQSKERISSKRRRFSGILIDIFYDHFLALYWETYNTKTLSKSTQHYYYQLTITTVPIPTRLKEAIIRMPKIDLLYKYKTIQGIEHAVNRVSQRIRFENQMHGGVEELENNYEMLEKDFHLFFVTLQKAVKNYKSPSLESFSHKS